MTATTPYTPTRRSLPPLVAMAFRRALIGIVLIVLVSFITFWLLSIAPGDPVATLYGIYATPEQVAIVHQMLGLDQPLLTQFWNWLSAFARGDLGESLLNRQEVGPNIVSRLPVTLALVLGTVLVSSVAGIALGTLAALRGGFVGRLVDLLSMIGVAAPGFWLGIIFARFFGVTLGWLPPIYKPAEMVSSLVLPILALTVGSLTGLVKQTRDAVLTELGMEYVAALRMTGLSERRILLRHVLKNASIPIITVIGVSFVGLFGGTVLVENVFAIPGLGSLATSATASGDIPVVLAVAVVFCIAVVVINFVVDVAYTLVNPRVRAGR